MMITSLIRFIIELKIFRLIQFIIRKDKRIYTLIAIQ